MSEPPDRHCDHLGLWKTQHVAERLIDLQCDAVDANQSHADGGMRERLDESLPAVAQRRLGTPPRVSDLRFT